MKNIIEHVLTLIGSFMLGGIFILFFMIMASFISWNLNIFSTNFSFIIRIWIVISLLVFFVIEIMGDKND